ncbi:GGDEF domain-containing protein [Myxococcota bacterium]|nr:GGDEF domain-containing protein [Myxococcota bacterium]
MTDPRDPSARPGLSCRILNQIIEENPECIVVTDPAGAIVHVNRRFEEAIRRRNDRPGRDYTLSLSLGISVSSGDHPVPLHALLDLADQRMYENKRRKKGR